MKILLCHNHYREPGGEDQSFAAEGRLLESHGHDVLRFTVHNDSVTKIGGLRAARETLWSSHAYRGLRDLIRLERPDVLHCTNIFPLMSPSVYYASRAEGVPVLQSLRNYRLLCPNALFLRDGRPCEDCVGKAIPWPSVVHACYRDSRAASSVVSAMLAAHRAVGTWSRAVDLYFAVSEFSRRKFIDAGWPAARIAVKPNFVDPDPGPGKGEGGYAVFVGRLSREKGLETLLSAWAGLDLTVPLKIVGDGPQADLAASAAASDSRIEWLGRRSQQEVLEIVGSAACLIMPSIWYETFGRTIVEAYARGTPVVASRLGAMAELVDEGRTGRLFQPGNAADLASNVRTLLASADELSRMRTAARVMYEQKYTAASNYRILMDLYARAAALKNGGRSAYVPLETIASEDAPRWPA